MPEEIEVPTEQLHETLKGHAEHGAKWIGMAALSSALIAVAAAIGSLLASQHANEAMLEQMQATDQCAYFQAKGIKVEVLDSKLALLESLGKPVPFQIAIALAAISVLVRRRALRHASMALGLAGSYFLILGLR